MNQSQGRRYRYNNLVLAFVFASGLPLAPAMAQTDEPVDPLKLLYELVASDGLGLIEAEVFSAAIDAGPGEPLTLAVPIEGQMRLLELVPYSVRSGKYELLVAGADGTIVPAQAGPVRTLRGTVAGEPNSRVAASLLENGLHATIDLGDGRTFFVEPISHLVGGAADQYVVYENKDVLPSGGSCGVPEGLQIAAFPNGQAPGASPPPIGTGGSVCIAELGCDADTEYFTAHGTVANTEARINSVINAVNLQYEQQVGLTHQITTIIVRTGPDPYTSTSASGRLCQFILEWTNNQTGIQRDLAHLFTGVDLDGGTIGIAADIGGSGVCVSDGACTGGPFGPLGSYCLSQADFNPNFSCATDLVAHEMGHLWGAFHCSCPNNTMNTPLSCTNSFSAGSISSITNYRDTRACMSGTCATGPIAPANDNCANATALPCNTTEILNTSSSTPAGGNDPELPAGSPSCQWQGIPTNTHYTVWYSFFAEDTSVEILTCATFGIDDTIIALYDGSCGSLVELSCSEDVCGASTFMSRICYGGLTPGNTYLVMVGHPGGWGGSTPGQVILELNCPCPDIGPVAGACCLTNGTCVDLQTPASCAALGGTFQGAGTDCGSTNCGPATEACCFGDGTCQDLDPADCTTQGGTPQGPGTNCAGTTCPGGGNIVNLATADFNTNFGSITGGSYLDTHDQDDVTEAITEEETNGNPARRRSRLEHTWTFNVASGSSYTFFIDAYHTANLEGDDFRFSYSLDNASYTEMVVVTKTADDNALQAYGFTENIAGTVYVRVEDTDRSQGNRNLDTVFVDEMIIVTSTTPDIDPPAAPTSLTATGGDSVVSLDWGDNTEPDLDGYNVYRSLGTGGPYTQINASVVANSSYADTTVTNGTTYFYVVSAVDISGNESGDSNEAFATPQAGVATTTHVDSIVVTTFNAGQGNKRGRADVTVRDNTGALVTGAQVTGTFTGDLNETVIATTGSDGVAVLITFSTKKGSVNIQFCVDDITHASLVYNDADNVETCDTN